MKQAGDIWQFQGAFLVARGDSILVSGGCGFANKETNRRNNRTTNFLIGSLTKPFTAIAIMQLMEKGLVDPEKPLSTYLPGYPHDVADIVTIHDLLAHRSGIPDVVSVPDFAVKAHNPITPSEIVDLFGGLPLDFEPGQQFAYSSSNYVLLGMIIEAVTGMTWEEYIESSICRPLDMQNTRVYYDYSERADFAKGYTPGSDGYLVEAGIIHPSRGYAAGSLASTVDDLFKLHRALYNTAFLSAGSVASMFTPHSPAYGYGWIVDDFGGHKLTAHGGSVPGYVSIMQRWVYDSVCVIVLSNNVMAPVHTIANALAAIALDESYEMPMVKKPTQIATRKFVEYEGRYKLSSGEYRQIELHADGLFARRSSGVPYPVLPEGADKFYFAHDHMTTLSFIRDDSYHVVAHILTQAFDSDTAWLVGTAPYSDD